MFDIIPTVLPVLDYSRPTETRVNGKVLLALTVHAINGP